MRIKKKNNNIYLLTEDNIWVRNFLLNNLPIDLNNLISESDYNIFMKNELDNSKQNLISLEGENIKYRKCVILSDGIDYKEKQELLYSLPRDICIIAVNGALAKWQGMKRRPIDFYLINNPYPEALSYLPKETRYFPRCICSTRTNSEFLELYNGIKLEYTSTPTKRYCGLKSKSSWAIDDYRNPICAAINIAYKFGVDKLLLFSCDEIYKKELPGTIKQSNGYYVYPQHIISHNIIDSLFYWFKSQVDKNINIKYNGLNPEFKNASYIKEEDIIKYFMD